MDENIQQIPCKISFAPGEPRTRFSNLPPDAIDAYVVSIELFPWFANHAGQNESRRCVARCLATFAEIAPREQRKSLWKTVHDRWHAWGFKNFHHDMHLMEICRSDLDYGVTAYAAECMTDAERNGAVEVIRQGMESLENEWHASLTDCVTVWNRLLSQMQPYAHAMSINLNSDQLLTETLTYWPSLDKNAETYARITFQIRS